MTTFARKSLFRYCTVVEVSQHQHQLDRRKRRATHTEVESSASMGEEDLVSGEEALVLDAPANGGISQPPRSSSSDASTTELTTIPSPPPFNIKITEDIVRKKSKKEKKHRSSDRRKKRVQETNARKSSPKLVTPPGDKELTFAKVREESKDHPFHNIESPLDFARIQSSSPHNDMWAKVAESKVSLNVTPKQRVQVGAKAENDRYMNPVPEWSECKRAKYMVKSDHKSLKKLLGEQGECVGPPTVHELEDAPQMSMLEALEWSISREAEFIAPDAEEPYLPFESGEARNDGNVEARNDGDEDMAFIMGQFFNEADYVEIPRVSSSRSRSLGKQITPSGSSRSVTAQGSSHTRVAAHSSSHELSWGGSFLPIEMPIESSEIARESSMDSRGYSFPFVPALVPATTQNIDRELSDTKPTMWMEHLEVRSGPHTEGKARATAIDPDLSGSQSKERLCCCPFF